MLGSLQQVLSFSNTGNFWICAGLSFDADGGFVPSQLKGVAYMSNTISKVCFVFFYLESAVCVADPPQQSSQPPSTRTKHDKQIEQLNLPEDTSPCLRVRERIMVGRRRRQIKREEAKAE